MRIDSVLDDLVKGGVHLLRDQIDTVHSVVWIRSVDILQEQEILVIHMVEDDNLSVGSLSLLRDLEGTDQLLDGNFLFGDLVKSRTYL